VIVSSRTAADQLVRTLENHALMNSEAPAGDRALLLPDVLTRAEWYERLHERLPAPPRRLDAMERDVLMTAAAREAVAGGAPPPFTLQAGLLAEMLAFYDELRRHGRTVDSFERLLVSDLEPDVDTDRGAERMLRQTRFLAAAFRGYEARVAESGAVDEPALRSLLLDESPSRPFRHIVVTVADRAADPDGLWLADFDLLARLPGVERIDIIATDATLASGFHERLLGLLPGIEDCRCDAALESSGRPTLLAPAVDSESLFFVSRDREEEIADIARRLKRSVRAAAAAATPILPLERTAIVFKRPLPYVYLAREVLTAAGIPYQMFDALPLAAEPYAGALDLLFECVTSGFTRRAIVALLRSPHLAFDADGRQVQRLEVSAFDRALGDAGYLGGAERLRRVADDLSIAGGGGTDGVRTAARAAAAAADELGALERDAPPSRHVSVLLGFLDRHERLPRAGDPLGERYLRARSAIRSAVELLGRAHQRFDDEPRPFGDVAATVRRWIEAQTFTPRAGSSGVQLLDARAARYGDADDVHLVGLIEGEWPQAAAGNIFYPPFLLKGLGWPEPRARLEGERRAFQDLLTLAGERVAISTFKLENDAIVSPSVFVEDLERANLSVTRVPTEASGRVFVHEALAGDPVAPAAVTEMAADWLALRRARRDARDAVFHGTAGPHRPPAFAVGGLERYGDCPFRFFAERVLELEEEPEDEPTRSPKARGKFVHSVFQAFFEAWSQRGRHAITPENLDEARALCAEVAEPMLARLPAAEASIERATLFGSAAAEGMVDSVCRVEAERPTPVLERLLEYRLSGGFDIEGADGVRRVALRGVADRIDLLEDGTFRLIDYKLGGAPDSERALQLPIYAVCAGQRLGAVEGRSRELAEAGYIAFGDPKRFVPMVSRRADRQAVIHDAQARVIRAIDGMARGEFPPRPAAVSMCRTCPYSGVCRKDYVGDT
jgi:RecB family exonuclease/inactivated superfamily I helicase